MQVEGDGSVGDRRRFCLIRRAETSSDPGEQLGEAERFRKVVIRSGFKVGHAVRDGVLGGQDDDRKPFGERRLPCERVIEAPTGGKHPTLRAPVAFVHDRPAGAPVRVTRWGSPRHAESPPACDHNRAHFVHGRFAVDWVGNARWRGPARDGYALWRHWLRNPRGSAAVPRPRLLHRRVARVRRGFHARDGGGHEVGTADPRPRSSELLSATGDVLAHELAASVRRELPGRPRPACRRMRGEHHHRRGRNRERDRHGDARLRMHHRIPVASPTAIRSHVFPGRRSHGIAAGVLGTKRRVDDRRAEKLERLGNSAHDPPDSRSRISNWHLRAALAERRRAPYGTSKARANLESNRAWLKVNG